MVDRTDIDALLIGSLYGEISSSDEARLRAHLESHPADRSALEGLVRTRAAFRESRIFEAQAEPPQAVSALLMQEAARRAPRAASAGEGWFVRLRRSFLMHPAMAAAAMLVVVASVAGTVYMRKGDHFAKPEVAAPAGTAAEEAAGSAAAAAPAPPPAAGTATLAADQADEPDGAMAPRQEVAAVQAKMAAESAGAARDTDQYRVGLVDGKDRAALQQQAAPGSPARPTADPAEGQADRIAKLDAEKAKVARAPGPSAGLEVSTPRPEPKELDEDAPRARSAKGRAQADTAKPADEAPAAEPTPDAKRGDGFAPRPPAAAPAAAPAAPAATGAGQGAGGGGPGGGGVIAGEAQGGEGNLSWAKDLHTRLIAQVRAGQCTEAAGTAVELSSRAPGYYQQNVENDRSVKSCLPYINAERERAAERARARAATIRRAGAEPAAPAQKAAQKKAAPAKPTAADQATTAPAKTN